MPDRPNEVRLSKEEAQDKAIRDLQLALCELTGTDPADGLPFPVQMKLRHQGEFVRNSIARAKYRVAWIGTVSSMGAGAIIGSLFQPINFLHTLFGKHTP